ncbi:HlyD family secretion protein [Rubripirellula reticaptiva]|uniref:Putative efflux pump membrane fusion protein n=1 Tax=Rubripirellula reticaptiva TaxID=2528013 RepID=A0A5C6F820_9BACT|nr:efflux RND transporter periplasmic adaptor subunit [Rubripirellula reticaptiva]TWU55661.1 putative efflux pump membrane fusion protein [Rubripirellula reticaptiva]
MTQTHTILLTLVLCCCGIGLAETRRRQSIPTEDEVIRPTPTRFVGETIRAPGRITGTTEDIKLHAQIIEPIDVIHVQLGDRVKAGDRLVTLDQRGIQHERELALAMLQEREAKLRRLENGARESEIEVARREYEASVSRLEGANARFERSQRLFDSNAISAQELEDVQYDLRTLSALAAASKNQLQVLQDPARSEDMAAAKSSVDAAKAELMMVEDRLRRAEITAPSDGTILKIDARKGELPGQPHSDPLIIMCNTQHQRALIEIDEFDALRVSMGQLCELSADGIDGVVARGKITEIEPRMERKKRYGQWAGERVDSFSRRAWIDLDDDSPNLPVGLPIRAQIEVAE